MWTREVTRNTTAAKEQIWKLWSDVPNWKMWDVDVEYSQINGDFTAGTTGVLKPIGGPKTKFIMTGCEPMKSFNDRSFLPLCTIDFIHKLEDAQNGVEITHRIEMTGILSFLFSWMIGKNMEKGLAGAVDNLIKQAEHSGK
jgi:hypothetical protein